MTSVHFVLCTMGTRGDIAPFAALATALAARGEQVTILSNENWRELSQSCGADFVAIAPQDPAQSGRDDFAFFLDNVLPSFKLSFETIAALHAVHPMVVVHKMGMLGAQCAAEKLGLPSIKVALQPSAIRSVKRPPWPLTVLASGRWRALTHPLVPAIYLLRDLTGGYRPYINRFRRSVGLRPVPLGTVSRTEDLTLVLCPPWFAMPQPDWPRNCHCVGFPFGASRPLDEESSEFVARQGAPLVFTPGTGMTDSEAFFETALQVCASTQMPGVFLSPGAVMDCPRADRILRLPFVDLGSLLPRARLLVHHGGIGTTAQAIRAGIPQVILPNRFDQPDNAMRIAALRLGAVALTARPTRTEWQQLVQFALNDTPLRARLAVAARDVRATDAGARAAEMIQKVSRERYGDVAFRRLNQMPIPRPQLAAHESA